jgi:Barstar (barnase inhibitor)
VNTNPQSLPISVKLKPSVPPIRIQVFYLDGREIFSKEVFLNQIAEAMQFPTYFGANWDALEECLKDLSWYPAQGYVLIYHQPEVFAQAQPEQWQVAYDILQSAVEYWNHTEIPMRLVLLNDGKIVQI